MSMERAAMRGKLADYEQKRDRLKLKLEWLAKQIRMELNTAITIPEKLNIPMLDPQWDDLKAAWMELQLINNEICRLNEELQ